MIDEIEGVFFARVEAGKKLSQRKLIAEYEARFQRLTDAMERWGWQHCTTEKELIQQIEDLIKIALPDHPIATQENKEQ